MRYINLYYNDLIRYIDIEPIFRYFRYIEASLSGSHSREFTARVNDALSRGRQWSVVDEGAFIDLNRRRFISCCRWCDSRCLRSRPLLLYAPKADDTRTRENGNKSLFRKNNTANCQSINQSINRSMNQKVYLYMLRLPSFDTVLHNARISFHKQCHVTSNCLIHYLLLLSDNTIQYNTTELVWRPLQTKFGQGRLTIKIKIKKIKKIKK